MSIAQGNLQTNVTCGDTWKPDIPAVEDIACQKKLNASGKHYGMHSYYGPTGRQPSVVWTTNWDTDPRRPRSNNGKH